MFSSVNLIDRIPPSLRRWYVAPPVIIVALGVVIPLGYLFVRAGQAEWSLLSDLVFRWRNVRLLWNTVSLTGGVLVGTIVLAFPLAWLTTKTSIRGKGVLTLLGVLPLAVPGYVMAYVLLSTTGAYGTLAQIADIVLPRLSGYEGALIALSLGTYPYLFLNLRTALLGLDPALEESAQALGYGRWQVFTRVILPQLRPAFLSGGLLVVLHVLGDFGVVSLMRFETFSYALYLQYQAAYDRVYAACLALMLLALTIGILFLEARLLRGLLLHRTGSGASRNTRRVGLGKWTTPAYIFAAVVGLVSVALPVLTVAFWMTDSAVSGLPWASLGESLWASVSASAPAAVLAALLALPVAYVGVREPSRATRIIERVAYLGYATPPLAFALALIVFTLAGFPIVYQTLALLVFAYALHFMAEAIGPIRSALYQAPPNLEEAARSLGRTPAQAFFSVTVPLLRRGLLVSVAFVFLSAMKELPITFLLSPPGFESLAMKTWSAANEAMFDSAAPYALAIMFFSAAFVGLLLVQEKSRRTEHTGRKPEARA
ncbi:iron ABC transporter permease [Longibacter salinarum]|uniref:Iron ABC transporter permease n=1 Tax=Longibacter salinarum TaxID=1850348 RepID=A0A2A8D003_9BACT|nr:iron ABC transporter permease [Longibacter salinarum]PEN14181.1 iron ABC transporter permease [Longibacter salinarum]